MKAGKKPFIALGMAAVLFLMSVLAPMPVATAQSGTSLRGGMATKAIKGLTSVGGKVYKSLSNKRWKKDCETWMAATGEQLDVMEDKIDGLDENIKAVQQTLGDIENQIDGVCQQIETMSQAIDQSIAQNTLTTRLQTINALGANAAGLCQDLNKIGDDSISQTERAQRVASFIKRVETDNLEGQFNTALNLLTEPDTSGKSIAEAYLDYLKVGKPFYFQIYDNLLSGYQNFSDILLSASYVLLEYYHYYSGPYNPRSPYITINQNDLTEKLETGLDAVYRQLDINDDDKPDRLGNESYMRYYGSSGKFIQNGVFEYANVVRLRSTVDEKYYMITVSGNTATPKWSTVFNLTQTPYGPTDDYLASETVSDGTRTYHIAKSSGEVYHLLRYYSDHAMTVTTSDATIYDFLFTQNPILNPNAQEVGKDGKAKGPMHACLDAPIAIWKFDDDGQYYTKTTSRSDDQKLTYQDAKNRKSILDPGFNSSWAREVFVYVFVQE
ncbi:hypothetical protein [Eubacterium sp. 1001713B170207_170306_E7]|uniref:hypothetical protein n=1 Tax=Eubacterium sp. 1001713B170207_170306_E7 TaxID=2787097 RepID=UPI00189C2D08|nr:hypothetical protein [Eubacterium sp. 1001713B170207_170306_E7]